MRCSEDNLATSWIAKDKLHSSPILLGEIAQNLKNIFKKTYEICLQLDFALGSVRSAPLNSYSQGEELHYCPKTAKDELKCCYFRTGSQQGKQVTADDQTTGRGTKWPKSKDSFYLP